VFVFVFSRSHQFLDALEVRAESQEHLLPNDNGRRDKPAHELLQLLHVRLVGRDIPFFILHPTLGKETPCRMAIASGGLHIDDDLAWLLASPPANPHSRPSLPVVASHRFSIR
jgi:hypothetical protein